MTSETITESGKITAYTYSYDNVSNRILKTENGKETVYTYNELNQLVTENDIVYEYDLNGNTVRMTSPDKSALYVYNAENRLIRATVQSGNNVSVEEYEYDYAGNRTVKKSEGEYTRYLLDINGSLTYVLAEMNFDGTEKCFYTRGIDLVSQERDGKKSYYVYDGHGSVRALFNEDGKVTDRYVYDAFGNLISNIGSTKNDFMFAGEQFDPITGLYYLRARYMNPSTGSFISMDSYSGSIDDPVSLHKYLYANSNPVMNSDPSGYFCLADISVTNFINDQLEQIHGNALHWVLSTFNNVFTLTETLCDMRDAEDWNGFFKAMLSGIASGILDAVVFNRMCEMKALKDIIEIISRAATMIGLASQAQSVADALDEGDVAEAVLRAAHLVVMLGLTFESCFTGDTEVSTENGLVCIEDIEVGDKVWAYDIYTGETALKEVLQVYVKENDTILHLETSDGETIDTTTNHPFYVNGEGWVAAGDLEIGYILYTVDGDTAEVTDIEIEKIDEPITVYNLDVADFDTYFVGEYGILVHNYSNNEPSPALMDSPYNPSTVDDRVKPPYESNPAHNSHSGNYSTRKSPEPSDAKSVYETALRGNGHTWYGIGKDGVYQFYSNGGNYGEGTVHFAGILDESDIKKIPNWIRRQLELD